jgi:hypothetical protein
MRYARWIALACGPLLAGCGVTGGNHLDGSLAELVDLSFDHTRVRLYESEVSVEYVDTERNGIVALRVTVHNDGDLSARTTYDLATQGHVGTSDELDAQLPDLSSGELKFSRFSPEEGETVKGSFDALFETPDQTRLSVVGGFVAELEVVSL